MSVSALHEWLARSCCQRLVTLYWWYLYSFHKILIEVEKQLIRDFSGLCDWFVGNKLSIEFGQDKTKSILFGTKHELWNAKPLNIVYNGIEIRQHGKVKYLECILNESLSGKSMPLNVIDKVIHVWSFYINQIVF